MARGKPVANRASMRSGWNPCVPPTHPSRSTSHATPLPSVWKPAHPRSVQWPVSQSRQSAGRVPLARPQWRRRALPRPAAAAHSPSAALSRTAAPSLSSPEKSSLSHAASATTASASEETWIALVDCPSPRATPVAKIHALSSLDSASRSRCVTSRDIRLPYYGIVATGSPNSLLRLRKHADYGRVYNSAKKQHARQMSYFFSIRPAAGPGWKSLAAAIPPALASVSPSARSSARRWSGIASSAVSASASAATPPSLTFPVDVILHPRRTVLTLDHATLDREVTQIFRSIQNALLRAEKTPAA